MMKILVNLSAALSASLLGGCAQGSLGTETAPTTAGVAPSMKIALPKGFRQQLSNWQEEPHHSGDWDYNTNGATSSATFTSSRTEPMFRVSCDASTQTITLARLGITAAEGNTMTVYTETLNRVLATATPDRSVLETLSFVQADDRVLDALAVEDSRFAIRLSLFVSNMPTSKLVKRVIDDCRQSS